MKKYFIAFSFLSIIILILIFKLQYHELWKDEWQAWLIARDMPLLKMLSYINYEGHPSLWYLCLKPFTYFSNIIKEDVIINLCHFVLFALTMYILFFKFEMHYIFKALTSFSYFTFFEFGVVNRGYILVALLSFAAVYYLKKARMEWFGISLILLCQTEVYGVIIGGGLLCYYFFTQEAKIHFYKSKPFIMSVIGLIIFVLTVFPRGHSDDFSRVYNQNVLSLENFLTAFQGITGNVFAIGLLKDTATAGVSNIGILLSVLCLVASVCIISNNRNLLFTWLVGLCGFGIFTCFVYSGGVRHWGNIFIFFICILELRSQKNGMNDWRFWLSALLCIPNIIHNFRACTKEYKLNFSNAKEAAAFIEEKIPMKVPIIALNKFETVGAAAYAGRKFYELPSGETFSYFKCPERIYIPTQSELILFAKYKKVGGIVLVSPEPIDQNRFPMLQLWKKFDDENFKSEDFFFYVLKNPE